MLLLDEVNAGDVPCIEGFLTGASQRKYTPDAPTLLLKPETAPQTCSHPTTDGAKAEMAAVTKAEGSKIRPSLCSTSSKFPSTRSAFSPSLSKRSTLQFR